MNRRIITLLITVFVLCISSMVAVSAADNTTVTKTVKVNKKVKLSKTLNISKDNISNYSFSSSKKKVASVSSKGVIKAKKAGNAVITVTSKEDGTVFAKVNIKAKNRYSKSELRLMSSIIFCEAGCESYAGQLAVGIVIMNRVKSPSFANSVSGVIYQPGQFTPARNGFLSSALSKYDSGRIPKSCISAAKETLNGRKDVTYGGKTIHMSSYLFFSGYVSGCRLQIGGHQFK